MRLALTNSKTAANPASPETRMGWVVEKCRKHQGKALDV